MALPSEILIEEILMRLPVKHLVRCRSVCKSWNSLFSDPDFIESHLYQNPNDDYLVFNTHCQSSGASDHYYYLSIISLVNLSETRIDKFPYPRLSKSVHLVGSINGLGCPYWTGSRDDVIVKFQVSNEEFLILPIPGCRPFCLANLNESLALIQYARVGALRNMTVYHYSEECSNWSKSFTINLKEKISMCFKYGGEIVFDRKKKLYDPKSNKIKNLLSYDDK
ncbi:hypothetical protein POM88_040773 [Heracleum sosnowskyi]|uniref:F-box domain-containing protein n=1 Tax=Heracleum sosnowskyi TaxID=360622 RepID=A0AAD8HCW4_9APIA|nr:hypothetical protein POM88_040773 [Heracleum sosnowskyi]